MEQKYLQILAQETKLVFEAMTGNHVYDLHVKLDEREQKMSCIDVSVPYEYVNNDAKGTFVLSLCDEEMACQIASVIGTSFGLPPIEEFGDTAVEVLSEFMNTVVGQAITAWDNEGLSVRFGPPSNSADVEHQKVKEPGVSYYVVILHLKVGYLTLQVTFKETRAMPLKGRRVLVVDDSALIRNLISSSLQEQGIDVTIAEDGMAAVEAYRASRPELTIMDVVMPKLGGLEAISKIREFDKDPMFIVLTSSSRKDQVVTARNLEVTRYMLKPVKIQELVQTVQHLLEDNKDIH